MDICEHPKRDSINNQESVCQAKGSVLSATHSASTLPEVEAPPEDEVAGSVLFVSTPSDSDGLADSLS